MKKLTRRILPVLGLMISLTAIAGNNDRLIAYKGKKVTRLYLENVVQGSQLTVKDLNGSVLYKEDIVEPGEYSKGFDLTTLPEGDYYFELNSEFKIEKVSFKVEADEISIDNANKELIYKSQISKRDDKVFVWRPGMDESELKYTVYYAGSNDFVLSEQIEKMEKVSRTYDFSKAKKGYYVFVFESNGTKYTKTINI